MWHLFIWDITLSVRWRRDQEIMDRGGARGLALNLTRRLFAPASSETRSVGDDGRKTWSGTAGLHRVRPSSS